MPDRRRLDATAEFLSARRCAITPMSRVPRVVVIGAGLAGTATAIRLLRFARDPLEVAIVERRPEFRCAGPAYHRDGNPWEHVFNIQAGRMSMFREDVDDFILWANSEADRRDWPEPWASAEFVEAGPAPRRIYHDYLTSRLAEAAREACPGVRLTELDGEAVDVRVRPDGVDVSVACHVDVGDDGRPETVTRVISARHLVIATGLELKNSPFAADVLEHRSFIRQPYSADGLRRITAVSPTATVAIVGSVLSAYDSAALLVRRGHTGKIFMISRSGTTLRTYPDGHRHEVVELPCPELLMGPYTDRETFLDCLREEWSKAQSILSASRPDVDPRVRTEHISKAWEPYLPAIIEEIPAEELRRLLDEFGTTIATARVGAVAYTTEIVERALESADGPIELVVGAVQKILPDSSGRLAVTVATRSTETVMTADLVISNFGRESDYEKVDSALWHSLVRQGLAVPHRRTGRGVNVDELGMLTTVDGEVSGPISVVGVLREGDELVRNGRTGAFSFNLAAIKNHSVAVAAHVVERLEMGDDDGETWACARDDADSETAGRIDEATALEVRRMATRARQERERVDARVEELLGSMDRPTAARRLALRRTILRSAVRRLTDVSVTPRELRRQLGLDR